MNSAKNRDFASQVLHLISELVKNNEMCDRECVAQYGVTASQSYTILSFPEKGTLSMNELSKTMNVDNSTMTRMVDQLVGKALVCRKPDEKDRRLVRVGLTTHGQDLRRGLEEELKNFYKEALDEIQENERTAIIHSLERLNQAYAKAFRVSGASCGVRRLPKRSLEGTETR